MERRVYINRISIKKSVSEALQLDDGPNPNDAYIKYLECMQTIISSLLHDASSFGDVTRDTTNFVTLGQQCMERIALLVQSLPKASDTHRPAPLSLPPANTLHSFESEELDPFHPSSLPTVPSHQSYVPPATPTSLILQSPTERFSSPANNVPSVMTSPTSNALSSITHQTIKPSFMEESPVEVAQRQNKKLLAAYHARMARTSSTQHQATLNLTLQRRLAENLAVARLREKTITRKLEERHQRLQQDAVRRFNNAADMSKEELERHHLYTQILDYEKTRNKLVVWRERLEKSPEDNNIITSLVQTVLSLPDHPLTQLVYQYQHAIYNKLCPLVQKYGQRPLTVVAAAAAADNQHQSSKESNLTNTQSEPCITTSQKKEDTDTSNEKTGKEASTDAVIEEGVEAVENGDSVEVSKSTSGEVSKSTSHTLSPSGSEFEEVSSEEVTRLEVEGLQRHLRNIVADVHQYLDQLISMFTVAYQPLGTPSGKDICYSAIEEPFFKPIWGYVSALFRIVDCADEQRLKRVMARYGACLPSAMDIPARYCLEDNTVPTTHAFPYAPAVQELCRLSHLTSPLSQLECIVRVSRSICTFVEDYYKDLGKPETTGLGADDLLPILSYVIVRSGRPQLVAECHVLDQLIHEGYLLGEEGYCLTTLQTALGYVLTLDDQEQA